jgi:hypothetical protein
MQDHRLRDHVVRRSRPHARRHTIAVPVMPSTMPAAAAAPIAPGRPRGRGHRRHQPESAQYADRPGVRAIRPDLLDGGTAAETLKPVSDQVGGLAFAF